MSIFFGDSPPITMKRTETSRTCFCLLEDIRNRGRSFPVLGALAVCVLTVLQKPEREGGPRMAPLLHRFRCAFVGADRWGRFADAKWVDVYT